MDDEKGNIQYAPLPENRGTETRQPTRAKRKQRPRGTGCIFRPKDSRFLYISYYVAPGRQVTESARTTVRAVAQSLLQTRLDALRRGERDPRHAAQILISELFNDLLISYRTNGHATLLDTESRIRLHLAPFFGVTIQTDKSGETIKFVGGMRAATISNVEAQAYILHRREQDSLGGRKKGTKDATIANELSILRRALSLAVQNGKLPHRPYIGLPKHHDIARSGFLSLKQYRNLFTHLPEHVRPFVSLAFSTGMRRGELLSLRWDQVDLGRAFINLSAENTKTRTARQIPIPAEALELLRVQRQRRDTICPTFPLVFFRPARMHERTGSPRILPLGDFGKIWEGACVAAGLGAMVGPEGKQKYKGLLVHDLRRSAVRQLLLSGTPQHVAMKISGHKTESMLRRYAIVSEADLTAAANRLTNYLDSASPVSPTVQPSHLPRLVN